MSKPSIEQYNQALKDIMKIIPDISHKIAKKEKIPLNHETLIQLNQKLLDKVKNNDEEILDLLWDLSWSGVLKNAVNIITYYQKDDIQEDISRIKKLLY